MNEFERGNPFATSEQRAAPDDTGVDYADVGKGFVGGVGRGTTGLLGLPGTVSQLMTRGGEWIGDKLGLPPLPEDIKRRNAAAAPFTPEQIQRPIERITGSFYEPTTTAGKYASTIGEFAPAAAFGGGGALARTATTVIPAVASETAGQLTEGTPYEGPARAIAGIGAGLTVPRVVTLAPPPPRKLQQAVDVFDREGIPMLAGDRTGSNAVRWLEATAGDLPLSSGRYQTLRQNQADALNAAVTRRTFDPAELERRGLPPEAALPDTDVFAHGRQSLRDKFNDLASRNTLPLDQQLIDDLRAAHSNYAQKVLPSQQASGARDIADIHGDIFDKLLANQGRMSGAEYQAIRSRLGDQAQSAFKSDTQLGKALKDTQRALDAAIRRNMSPADAAAWDLANQRYANMKQITNAVAGAKENMTPARLAQAVRAGRAEQYAAGQGNLDELVNAASTVIREMPSSGTAQRLGYQKLFDVGKAVSPSTLTTGALGGAMGAILGPAGAFLGLGLPMLAGRIALSRVGQRYLANQAIPQTRRDLIAQALAQQVGSTLRPQNANP